MKASYPIPSELPVAARHCYQFGPFLADLRKRLLWRGDAVVSLTPKAFEILAVLLESRGRVVEKEELLVRVWGNTAVEDATLARHVSTLRKALDERPNQHLYVVTVPGHGYEFVADTIESDQPPVGLRHTVEPISRTPGPIEPAVIEAPFATAAVSSAAVAPRPARVVPWFGFVIGAVIISTAAAVLVAFDFGRGQRQPAQRSLRQFTYHGGLQREPAWSPDGQSVAYTSDASGNSDIWVQRVTDPHPARLTTSDAEDSQPAWSPDGRSIVFRSERNGGGLYRVPATGGAERALANFGFRPKWSPDGTLVLFSSSGHQGGMSRMYIVAADGGTPNLLRPDALDNFSTADAAWKPGSRQVSLWGRGRGQDWMFVTIPVDSGPAITSLRQGNVDRQLRDANLTLGRFVWSRSGRNLFFEGVSERVRNLWRVTIDPSTLAWVAGPDRLTTGAGPDADVALSPDGTRLVFSTRQSLTRLWAFPFDAVTGQVKGIGEPVTSGGAGEQDADAPLDGNKLVYTAMRGNRQEIWEKSTVDQSERLLISTAGWNRTRPRWSPDGSSLAYMRTRSDAAGERAEPAVAVLPIGGNERLLTRPGEVRLVPTDWSPDGRWLLGACQSGAGRGVGTCVLPVSTEVQSAARVRVVASDPARNLFESRFSPNQQWVCFVAVDTADARASRIYVVPIGGGPWRPVTEGAWYDDKPHWSRDGKTLYFVSNRQGFFNVWGRRFDPASGTPSGDTFQVTNFTSSRQTISPELSRMQIAVTARHLFLPITETSGELWALDNIDR